jgi:hypothetical protein
MDSSGESTVTKFHSLALSLTLIIGSVLPALAQQPTQQEYRGTANQRSACRYDVLRYCGAEIPNVARITACLRYNIARISPQCAAVFADEQPRKEER